jgi:succinyl-CoA synthetase beta subunit
LRHLLDRPTGRPWRAPTPTAIDEVRRRRWQVRLAAGPLDAAGAFALLAEYGLPVVPMRAAQSGAEARAAADELGYPVVMKTDEPAIAHKSDVGGVVLGLDHADAVDTAYQDLAARLGRRVTVSATADDGVELALGLVHDPHLGPLVVVGAGGVLVEIMADAVVRLPPVDEIAALAAIGQLRLSALLDGVRGGEPVDRAAVAGAVVALSGLAVELGDHLAALDVNPLRCGPRGCVALDVLVEVRR